MTLDSDAERPQHPLLVRPTPDQARLLGVIWDAFVRSGGWPTFDYVERVLYNAETQTPLFARDVLSDCPWVMYPHGLSAYGWVWSSGGRSVQPSPDHILGLTVVGHHAISHPPVSAPTQTTVDTFISALRAIARAERSFLPQPQAVVHPEVAAATLAAHLKVATPSGVARLRSLLHNEPPLWGAVQDTTGGPGWTVRPQLTIRPYSEVDNMADYLERVIEQIAPPATTTTRAGFFLGTPGSNRLSQRHLAGTCVTAITRDPPCRCHRQIVVPLLVPRRIRRSPECPL